MDLKNLAEDIIEIYNNVWTEAFFTKFEQKKQETAQQFINRAQCK